MRKLSLLLLILIFPGFLWSQSDSGSVNFEFLPSGLHFAPLKANYQEARLGVLYYPSNGNLKVDIGNTIDLLGIGFPKIQGRLTMGVEFMAFAYSTSFKGNRLQIDAVDGFFGGNAAFSKTIGTDRILTRFRIIHNSAHFVDGHYDLSTQSWIGNKGPIPFTRDFGELILAYEKQGTAGYFRGFGGAAYATLVRPLDIKKYSFSSGFEYAIPNLFGKVFNKNENIFLAYYVNLAGTPVYQGSNNFVFGMKFGSWLQKGILLYLNYYSGTNMFSEYYKERVNRLGFGFSVDFP